MSSTERLVGAVPRFLGVALVAALGAAAARADVWDLQDDDDDWHDTDNQLVHGTVQLHDLGVRPGPTPDQDWFKMPAKPYSSYEVVIDGVSGDLLPGLRFERVAEELGTPVLLQSGVPAVAGMPSYSMVLRWAHVQAYVPDWQYVRIWGGACATGCGADDVYSVRARETTINIARFNAVGSQATILLTQNVSDRPVRATFVFWGASGALLQTRVADIASRALDVFDVASVPGLAGQAGSVSILHDGGYGGLNAKAVAVEPATGFTFDTPGTYVPD